MLDEGHPIMPHLVYEREVTDDWILALRRWKRWTTRSSRSTQLSSEACRLSTTSWIAPHTSADGGSRSVATKALPGFSLFAPSSRAVYGIAELPGNGASSARTLFSLEWNRWGSLPVSLPSPGDAGDNAFHNSSLRFNSIFICDASLSITAKRQL